MKVKSLKIIYIYNTENIYDLKDFFTVVPVLIKSKVGLMEIITLKILTHKS